MPNPELYVQILTIVVNEAKTTDLDQLSEHCSRPDTIEVRVSFQVLSGRHSFLLVITVHN